MQDAEIESLKKELHEIQEIREQSVEATKLASALQSEQLGASRAVSQNQQLKQQLNEMHDAFVMLVSDLFILIALQSFTAQYCIQIDYVFISITYLIIY